MEKCSLSIRNICRYIRVPIYKYVNVRIYIIRNICAYQVGKSIVDRQ